MINNPVQGPMTEAQTAHYHNLMCMMVKVTKAANISPRMMLAILRKAYADTMEASVDTNTDSLSIVPVPPHNCYAWMIEVGLIDCGYGCKVMRCEKCGKEFNSHRKVYGCPQG